MSHFLPFESSDVLNLTIADDTRESVLFFKNKTIHSKDYEYISYRM